MFVVTTNSDGCPGILADSGRQILMRGTFIDYLANTVGEKYFSWNPRFFRAQIA
jgi:hypothetical protein